MDRAVYNAVISGSSRTCIMLQGETLYRLNPNGSQLNPCMADDYRKFFDSAKDLEFVDDCTLAEAKEALAIATAREKALDLFMLLFNVEVGKDLRAEASGELETFLQDPAVAEQLESVLFATPVPNENLIKLATDCVPSACRRTLALFKTLRRLQPLIRTVWQAQQTTASKIFATPKECNEWANALVRAGAYRIVVQTMDAKGDVEAVFSSLANNQTLLKRAPADAGPRSLEAWLRLLVPVAPVPVPAAPPARPTQTAEVAVEAKATNGSVNKSQFIRDLLANNPNASLRDAQELWDQSHSEGAIQSSLFYQIRGKLNLDRDIEVEDSEEPDLPLFDQLEEDIQESPIPPGDENEYYLQLEKQLDELVLLADSLEDEDLAAALRQARRHTAIRLV